METDQENLKDLSTYQFWSYKEKGVFDYEIERVLTMKIVDNFVSFGTS